MVCDGYTYRWRRQDTDDDIWRTLKFDDFSIPRDDGGQATADRGILSVIEHRWGVRKGVGGAARRVRASSFPNKSEPPANLPNPQKCTAQLADRVSITISSEVLIPSPTHPVLALQAVDVG
jgi:hypothetical protein